MEKEIIYNVGVGSTFVYDNAVFVMCYYEDGFEDYPSMCIATKNSAYEVGEKVVLDEEAECKLIPMEKLFL